MRKKQIKILGGVPLLRKGDKLRIDVFPKPKVNPDNFMMLGKVREPSGKPLKSNNVDLHLTRKDAEYLREFLYQELKDGITNPMGDSIYRILNKLKREGIK